MKRLLIPLLLLSSVALSATVWTDQPSLYKQQKSNATTPATRYIKLTDEQVKAYVDALITPPVVLPTANNMPYVDLTKLPLANIGYSTLRLQATSEQPGASNEDKGAFRVSCTLSAIGVFDPLVYPGITGKPHLHNFFGNTGINPNSTTEALRTSGNSTCNGGIMNRSAYWVPALIDTATGLALPTRNALMYYKHGVATPFPRGLRMIAGNSMATTAPVNNSHVWFECNELYASRSQTVPACAKGGLITQQVTFPDCWNGTDLDSADHRSHMAYSSNGVCPATHQTKLPTLSMLVYTPVITDGTSKWKLSSDMYDTTGQKAGSSGHADFMMGWDDVLHAKLVENCINASKDCHAHLTGDGREFY